MGDVGFRLRQRLEVPGLRPVLGGHRPVRRIAVQRTALGVPFQVQAPLPQLHPRNVLGQALADDFSFSSRERGKRLDNSPDGDLSLVSPDTSWNEPAPADPRGTADRSSAWGIRSTAARRFTTRFLADSNRSPFPPYAGRGFRCSAVSLEMRQTRAGEDLLRMVRIALDALLTRSVNKGCTRGTWRCELHW